MIETPMKQPINFTVLIKWAIGLGIPLGIMLLPVNDAFTSEIRLFLALSVWLIVTVALDLFNNMLIPSFLLPILYSASGLVPGSIAYASWSNEILHVIIGAFILAAVLDDVGLLKRIAYWCVLKVGGNFIGIYWGVALASALITLLTFGNAYVVLATLCFGICKALNLGKSKASALIIMSGLVGTMTARMFIYSPQTTGLIELGVRTIFPDFTLPWYQYMFQMLPAILMCGIILWSYGKVYKIKAISVTGGKDYFQAEYNKLGKMPSIEKKAGFVLALLMIFLLTSPFHKLSANAGFLFLPILFFLPGFNVGSLKAIKTVDFGMLFFIASCLGIGVVGTHLGIGELVVSYMAPAMSSLSALGSIYTMFFFGTVLNFLLTPTAMFATLPGPITAIAVALNIDPMVLIYPFLLATDAVFLPYEYAPYLIFFSFGTITMGDFVKLSCLKIAIFIISILVLFLPYWYLIGLI